MDKLEALKRYFGHGEFRPGQAELSVPDVNGPVLKPAVQIDLAVYDIQIVHGVPPARRLIPAGWRQTP